MSSEQPTQGTEEKKRTFKVQNKMGLHARPAAMIVRITNKYADAEVWVTKDEESVNGKSIMGLIMLAAGHGSELQFAVSGTSADELLDELEAAFERKFEET